MLNDSKKKINYAKDNPSLKSYNLPKNFDEDYKNLDKKANFNKSNCKELDTKTTKPNLNVNETTIEAASEASTNKKATQKIKIDYATKPNFEKKQPTIEKINESQNDTAFSKTSQDTQNETNNPSYDELKAKQEAEEEEKNRNEEVKSAALLLQSSTLLALTAIPFLNILGPFLVKYYHKDKYPELKNFINELINFQISFAIYYFISLKLPHIFQLAVIVVWLYQTYQAFTKIFELNYGHKYPLSFKFFKG